MKTVKEVKVSPKGWSTTLVFEDGTKDVIPFESFLRVFNDYRKAVYEYMLYVFVRTSSRGRGDIAWETVKKIKAKLLPEADKVVN